MEVNTAIEVRSKNSSKQSVKEIQSRVWKKKVRMSKKIKYCYKIYSGAFCCKNSCDVLWQDLQYWKKEKFLNYKRLKIMFDDLWTSMENIKSILLGVLTLNYYLFIVSVKT